jgi:DNA-directed RNA polymerase specialized sigma24 family protein
MHDLESNDFDEKLKQSAIEAKESPPGSAQRQRALSHLIREIMRSRSLGHPQRGNWSANLYEDFRNEALSKTYLDICQKLKNYDPERGEVMAWFNTLLRFNFMEVVRKYMRNGLTEIPRALEGPFVLSLPEDEIAKRFSTEEVLTLAQLLRRFLQEDPEGLLEAESIRNQASVTLKFLLLRKYVDDLTWVQISEVVNIPFSTLSTFCTRCLKKPKIEQYFHKYLRVSNQKGETYVHIK